MNKRSVTPRKPRERTDQMTLPLLSSSDSVGSEESISALDDPYFPSRLSEMWHRLKYVFTYPI